MDTSESIFSILRKILGVYALLLIFVGTFTSLIACYICFRLRGTITFIFFCYLSISSIFTLYFWNLGNFLREMFGIDLININFWLCKFGSFYQFTSLQITAWILVLISIEQFLCVKIKHWRTLYFKHKRAIIVVSLLVVFFILLNLNILVLFGYENKTYNSTEVICYDISIYPSTKWMAIWGQVHLATYSVIPFIVLAISNFSLIGYLYYKSHFQSISKNVKIQKTASMKSKNQRQESMSKMIIFMTFLFIAMTLPTAFASFFFATLIKTDYGYFLIVLFNCITFSYHGLNFIIYYVSNNKFRSEFRKLFCRNG